jgi:hypothetical protein
MVNRKNTIEMIAARFRIPFNTLDIFDKDLVRQGVRPYAVRGKTAPQLTALDVAHIALAASGPRSVRSVAEDVAEVSALPLLSGIRELRDFDLSTQDFVFSQDGAKLTPTGIIKGATLQMYPRDVMPMADTFGASLARVIECTPFADGVEDPRVKVVWPPVSAQIRFRAGKFQYRLDFGVKGSDDLEEPIYTFEYSRRLLEWLGEIYRS